jgi:5-methylcytosine-specific restriction protein A
MPNWRAADGTLDKRRRGRAGQRDRARRMARTKGLCEHCLAEGRTQLATVVNHKVPLARGGEDVDENTENLCARHDELVTAQQFGKQAPIEARGVNAAGRPTSPDHPWNKR